MLLKDWILAEGIRLSYEGFNTNWLMPVVFADKVLEKYPARDWEVHLVNEKLHMGIPVNLCLHMGIYC